MPGRQSRSHLITFRVSLEEHNALMMLSSAHRCSLSAFVRTSMQSLVTDSELFLELLRPGSAAAGQKGAEKAAELGQQPVLNLLVELQQHARALDSQVRRLALVLTGRLAATQGADSLGRPHSD